MRIAVIDDEKYSRLELIHQIRQHLPQAEIFEASSGAQGIQLLEKDTFDILFIDIHLGDLEGTTVASLARRLMPLAKIIFATAYSEYAVTAFELRVDDYILKPFDPQRIRQALDQCVAELQSSPHKTPGPLRLAVSCNRHTILLDVNDVTYIETDGPAVVVSSILCPANLTATTLLCLSMKAAWMGRVFTASTRLA